MISRSFVRCRKQVLRLTAGERLPVAHLRHVDQQRDVLLVAQRQLDADVAQEGHALDALLIHLSHVVHRGLLALVAHVPPAAVEVEAGDGHVGLAEQTTDLLGHGDHRKVGQLGVAEDAGGVSVLPQHVQVDGGGNVVVDQRVSGNVLGLLQRELGDLDVSALLRENKREILRHGRKDWSRKRAPSIGHHTLGHSSGIVQVVRAERSDRGEIISIDRA